MSEHLKDQVAILRGEVRELRAENTELRELLWIRHGCPTIALYGDDGERQCSKCLLDFKRLPVKEITERWLTVSQRALSAALNPPTTEGSRSDE